VDPKQVAPPLVRSLISRWKNDDADPETAAANALGFVEEQAARLYAAYEEQLHACNALDFDDLILRTVHLLEQHEEVRLNYANRFRNVLVDEFQDTNPLQFILIKALASEHGNIFAVGDDDQSIYSWRGATIANMLNFEEYFPGTRLLRLEQNYRSSGIILKAANSVIAHNRQRKGKNLWTSGSDGEQIRIVSSFDAEEEAANLVAAVNAELARGSRRSDLTVLYRTNAQSRLLEDALRRANITYLIVGSVHFYERREVRDLRVINTPRRKLGEVTVGRLAGLAARENLTLGEAATRPELLADELPPAAAQRVHDFFQMVGAWRAAEPETAVPLLLERIIDETRYLDHLAVTDSESARERGENVTELVNATYAFHEASGGGRLAQFLEQVALISDQDALSDGEGAVRLMTIHTAKGLEFPVVLVTGCEDELLPHASSIWEDHLLEEERRLFYVALTRARQRVYLLHAGRRRRSGVYEPSLASRFLREIPAEFVAGTQTASQRQLPRHRAATQASRSDNVYQDEIHYYTGQTVHHGTFGSGVVARVEGSGDNLMVTVEFSDHGRKQVLPKYAPLRPLD
jgi:DNA helicase-2/ATP-dependent DNA helicase PcrA